MQRSGSDPLAQLRDIHVPAEVSWWPPAPGWWFAAATLIPAAVLLLWWWRRHQRRCYQRVALLRLEQLCRTCQDDPHALVRELSVLLRRAAILHYPAHDCAGLSGQEWLQFLDQTLDSGADPGQFSAGAGQCLADAPYRRGASAEIDTQALADLARCWLRRLPPLAQRRPSC